ncbi:L-seryl-tRNA(Sec) selenium transferase [Aggregatilinea lenta]|uniref:L-seryl-tRNA(Sec) selenium transferase n=1 Tax=Aggregatilinea lenta TaxID=913108 RepID=UPI000E5B3E8A|nr:L-seryl-tRNA(Sec) selenium transferase [Aggregatilinea lenta]
MPTLRDLPSIDTLLHGSGELEAQYGHERTVAALRAAVDEARAAVRDGAAVPAAEALVAQAAAGLHAESEPTLRPVINATGVIIHTNLGRAPLSDDALDAIRAVGGGYSTLEYDLEPGTRGKRDRHAERLLAEVTGAEAAMVVNNNAAGVLLALSALVQGREAIISRGQLVEIGGAFRIPDVMAQSGAIMVEVGATNRTRLRDYEAALTERTAAIVQAHPSNYRIVGFTESVPLPDLVALAHAHDLIVIEDVGSGALIDPALFGLASEPLVQDSLAAGADLVLFSGDKLLGGPQAGLIAGRSDLIARLKQHPLARAVRADKLCLAGLVATLEHYRRGDALDCIPVWRMIALPLETIRTRADAWAAAIPGEIVPAESTVGGGSLPGETLPTWAFAPRVDQPNAAAARLRQHTPPVIARVAQDRLLLDPRTVFPEQDALVLDALKALA